MTNFPDIADLKQHTKEEILVAYNREMSKRSLIFFFRLCMKHVYSHLDFIDNWHYEYICGVLQDRTEKMLRKEKSEHLLINCPIRAGKTILISEVFPVWLWIKSDKIMIQNVCCTQRLATKSSRFSKLILTSVFFQQMFPEIQLAADSKSKADYSTTNNGTRASYGIDSAIVGSSYNVLIADDLNDPADVNSEVSLNNVITVWQDVISGRMSNEWDFRVVLQQRTSAKDLCQHLLDNNYEDYRHICITGELTKDTTKELLPYYIDGLFFPKRYSHQRLAQYAKELSSQAYASQILQSPSALAGSVLLRNWFNIIKQSEFQSLPKGKIYLFLDTAYTSNVKNDPSGFYVCCVIGGKIYVMYAVEKWLEFYELQQEILELIKVWGIKTVYIEQKASGISTTTELKRTLRNAKVTVLGINPGSKSKPERAASIQNYLVNNRVVIVNDIWNEGFLTQIAGFPYAKNDSHVDNLTYSVLTLIAGRKYGGLEQPTIKDSRYDDSDFDLYAT